MIRICSDCKKDMGTKPPYEDTSVTHGMCPACVDKVREKLRERKYGLRGMRKMGRWLAGDVQGSVDRS